MCQNAEHQCTCGGHKDGDYVVCRCEEVYLSEIKEAVAKGVDSFGELRRLTRAGMGLCQGHTCGRLVRAILAQETGCAPKDIQPATVRAPVKPLPVETIGSGVAAEEFQDPQDTTNREAPRYANQIFEDAYGGDGPVVL